MDFDTFYRQWEGNAVALLDEGLLYITQLEMIPISDGVFLDFVRRLSALPFKREHAPAIIAILGKKDPHLQEVGVFFAAASTRVLNNHDQFEDALCAILNQDYLDPWVLEAINTSFMPTTYYTHMPEITDFFSAYASLAYDNEHKNGRPEINMIIMRTKMIRPFAFIKSFVEDRIAHSVSEDKIVKAMLPFVEKEYFLKGYDAVKRFLDEKYR